MSPLSSKIFEEGGPFAGAAMTLLRQDRSYELGSAAEATLPYGHTR